MCGLRNFNRQGTMIPSLPNSESDALTYNVVKRETDPTTLIPNSSREAVNDVPLSPIFVSQPSVSASSAHIKVEGVVSMPIAAEVKKTVVGGTSCTHLHSSFSDEKNSSVEEDVMPPLTTSACCTQSSIIEKISRKRKTQKPGLTARGEKRQFVSHHYVDRSHEFNDVLGPDADNLYEANKFMDTIGPRKSSPSASILPTSANNFPNVEQPITGKKKHVPFPFKLHIMLHQVEKNNLQEIVSWLPHGRAFAIHDIEKFKSVVMGKYFQQSKVTSFHRQLNLYGFVRITVGKDQGGYYNEYFLRGKPKATERIVRTKVKGTKIRAASSPEDEPDFYSMKPVNPPNFPTSSAGPQSQVQKDDSVEYGGIMGLTGGRQNEKRRRKSKSRNSKSINHMTPQMQVHRVMDIDNNINCQDKKKKKSSYRSAQGQSLDAVQVHSNPSLFNVPNLSTSRLIEPDSNQDMSKPKGYPPAVPIQHASYYDVKMGSHFSNQDYYRPHHGNNFAHGPMLVHDNMTKEKHTLHNHQHYTNLGESSRRNGDLSTPLPYTPSVVNYPPMTEKQLQHGGIHYNHQQQNANNQYPHGQFCQSSSLVPLPISTLQDKSSTIVSNSSSNSQSQKFVERQNCDPILDDMVNNMNWGKPPPHYGKDEVARSDLLVDTFENWDADGDSLVGDDMNQVDQDVSNKKANDRMMKGDPSSDGDQSHMEWTIELLLRL